MPPTRALDWLQPRPVTPLRVITGPPSAVHAGRRDGLAREVWPGVGWARDLPPGAAERVRAVLDIVPPGGVLARRSAVWVHTGEYRPSRLDVVLAGPRRRSTKLVQVHAEPLGVADVVRLGRGAVTSPARTAVDVARRHDAEDAGRCLAPLLAAGLCPAEVASALERAAGLPGVVRARAILAAVLAERASTAPS